MGFYNTLSVFKSLIHMHDKIFKAWGMCISLFSEVPVLETHPCNGNAAVYIVNLLNSRVKITCSTRKTATP